MPTRARGGFCPTLARRAYRRNVTNADVEPLMAFYREGQAQGGFDAGIEHALRRLLVSPEFLFRVERDPAGVHPAPRMPISDVELASRLSFFLWSSIPDDELLDLAAKRPAERSGRCSTQQVRRMLADPRAEAFVNNFAGQWLFLRNLDAVVPVQSIFPDFDDSLRQAFRRETELFFESIVREDRSALDLLRADYTFVNERLARHYGIPNVKGDHFRRVTLGPDSKRARAARAGQHPDRDVVPRPHLAGRSRQVDPREPARHAAAAAAAERAARCRPTTPRESCCRCASAWSSTGRIRSARAVTP